MRLRPLTDDRPKVLIEVNGRPMSELQIEWLTKDVKIDEVIFACGYKWEKLKEHFGDSYKGIPVSYSVEEEPLGTGGAIRRALMHKDNEDVFIVANGDIITSNSKPHLAKDRNIYLYTDASGQLCGIQAARVAQIEPQSMMAADEKNSSDLFKPSLKKQ